MAGRIVILGSGSWGMALANLLAPASLEVLLWPPLPHEYEALVRTRAHPVLLPGVSLDPRITILPEPVLDGDNLHVLVVVPSHAVREVVSRMRFLSDPGPTSTVICATKGLEEGSLLRMSQVLDQVLPDPWRGRVVTLSGPSLADEVARGVPTAAVVASPDEQVAAHAQHILARERFRVYVTDDLVGVEIAGALKNVIALAAGISDGLGYGDNTKGALLTRGMVEIARLGAVMGAREKTFAGLAGMGDLITTCVSKHSRNRHVGEQIGRGRQLSEVLAGMTMVAEGVRTTRAALALSLLHDVVMPITAQVHRILFEGLAPSQAMTELMLRDPKTEDGRSLSLIRARSESAGSLNQDRPGRREAGNGES
ncbi:MAG: NAD(P)-dependent glycerol-3-phosphate dehydrogenase [Candidatus Eisenbacteria bacterium]|nr:NAD(P)-dependent glycerol-3-phosphate dehydrogenase [Candidatus Eisenbacteria bacterium]